MPRPEKTIRGRADSAPTRGTTRLRFGLWVIVLLFELTLPGLGTGQALSMENPYKVEPETIPFTGAVHFGINPGQARAAPLTVPDPMQEVASDVPESGVIRETR